MTYIAELQKKYPTLPPEVIVKWEVLARGVKDTEGLDKVSFWSRPATSYQSYDSNVTLKQVAETREGRVKPGFYKRPSAFWMKNGIATLLRRDPTSCYEVREIGEGKFALFEGEEQIDMDIYFPTSKRLVDGLVTSRGTYATNLIDVDRRCFKIYATRHCQYFNTGEQCKFCNYNSSQEDARSIGIQPTTTLNLQDTVEAYKLIASTVRLVEGRLQLGGFTNLEPEVNIHCNFLEGIANAVDYKPNLQVQTQATDRRNLQRLKDAGLDTISLQMEVWDKELFAEVCPGKAKRDGHQRYLEAFLEAVDVLGPGNVGVAFVGGVTLVPPKGHKTWQEARDSHIEGNDWMIKNRIVPTFTSLRLAPGSVYGNDPANLDKVAPSEYYLDVALAHHQTMTEYGMYSKVNKFMWCPCLSPIYCLELGALAEAGDVGQWLADSTTPETNWVARFISSLETTD